MQVSNAIPLFSQGGDYPTPTARSTAVNVFASAPPRMRIRAAPTMISISVDAHSMGAPASGDVGRAVSTTTGTKLATGTCLRACLRRLKSCCGLNPWRRATSETMAPLSRLSMTTRALTSDGQRRRRPTPVITSTRSMVPGLVSNVRSTFVSNRCRPMRQNHCLRSV
jgi:hypothetical protein